MHKKSQNGSFLSQLKEKHSSPGKAYIEYELSKTCIRIFAHASHVSEQFLRACDLQRKINKYAETLILEGSLEGSPTCESIILDDGSNPYSFWNTNSRTLRFLGFEKQFFIDIASGNYRTKLIKDSQSFNWKNLARLMSIEKKVIALSDEARVLLRLNELSGQFGLLFVSVAKASAHFNIIDLLLSHFHRTVRVVGCKDQEFGAYQFSYFIELSKEVSNFNDFFRTQRIELNDISNGCGFAHEWAHGIDNLFSPCYGGSSSNFASELRQQNTFSRFVSATKLKTLPLDPVQTRILTERSKSHIREIMSHSNKTGGYRDSVLFRNAVEEELLLITDIDWDKFSFRKRAEAFQRPGRHGLDMIISEMELIRSLAGLDSNLHRQSIFFISAKILDSDYYYCYKSYWTAGRELFARAFDSYVDYLLEARGEQRLEPLTFLRWQAEPEEMKTWNSDWDELMNIIREKLKDIYAENLKDIYIENLRKQLDRIDDDILEELLFVD
jgi:hypothetical protein